MTWYSESFSTFRCVCAHSYNTSRFLLPLLLLLLQFLSAAAGQMPSEETPAPNPASLTTRRSPDVSEENEPPKLDAVSLRPEDKSAQPFSNLPVQRTSDVSADVTLNDVCCVGPDCWAVGERGVIVKSSDGGRTWSSGLLPFECSLQTVCFLTNKLGWVAGTRFGASGNRRNLAVLLQTRDGGDTWSNIVEDPTLVRKSINEGVSTSGVAVSELTGILKLSFFGLEDGVAISLPTPRLNNATLLRTGDGGRTWSPFSVDVPDVRFTTGAFLSSTDGVVGGEQMAHAAVVSEQAVVIGRPVPSLKRIRGISVSADGEGWIVGDGGFLLSTTNSGVTWKTVDTQTIPRIDQLADFRTVAQSGPIVLIAGAPGSCMLRSADRGLSWKVIPTDCAGEIRRLAFVDANTAIALGSLGTIIRSDDAGQTWSSVRSESHRAGLLIFATELEKSPWELVTAISGNAGVRTITAQLSPELNPAHASGNNGISETQKELTALQVMSQLGANTIGAEWLFPRNRPNHVKSQSLLIEEWNRQTDGDLRRILPLRMARLIRMWRPSVVVVHSSSDEDAVAQLTAEILPEAMRIAAEENAGGSRLDSLMLKPWTVDRVVVRCMSDRTTPLTFRRTDLLDSCRTTIGLMLGRLLPQLQYNSEVYGSDSTVELREKSCYELLGTGPETTTPAHLMFGLSRPLNSDARRNVPKYDSEDLQNLKQLAKNAELQNSALLGHMRLRQTQNSLIAELESLGEGLPPLLALEQLHELAEQNWRANEIDAFLAVLQEIIRRTPSAPEAYAAAEKLFLYYSSQEIRHYRIEQIQKRTNRKGNVVRAGLPGIPGIPQAVDSPLPAAATGFGSPGYPGTAGVEPGIPQAVTPKVEQATLVTFGQTSGQAQSLMQQWDMQAEKSLQLLKLASAEGVSAEVLVRQAANERLAGRMGEYSALLAEAAGRKEAFSLYATAESQSVHGSITPAIHIASAQKVIRRPYLDAELTDLCWENATEIFLTSDQMASADAEARSLILLAWDDEFLYLAGRMEHSASGPVPEETALNRRHDENHGARDRFEVHLDTDRDFSTAFELCVDQTGRTSESCCRMKNWNPEWYVATKTDSQVWRFEMAIPVAAMTQTPPRAGDLWSVRMQRIIPGHLLHSLNVEPSVQPAESGSAETASSGRDGRGMLRFIRSQPRNQK